MSISKSYNKQNGVTYVYEVIENYWDKEKKRPHTKRRLIGKIDPATNEIVPTSRHRNSAGRKNGGDDRPLYENAISEEPQKDEILTELKATLMEARSCLAEIENDIKKRIETIDGLLSKVEDHG